MGALSLTIDNIFIQVSGTDSQIVVQCPIQPMIPGNPSLKVLKVVEMF
jgi:hypothetical protein